MVNLSKALAVASITALLFVPATAQAHDGGGLSHKGKYLRAKVKREHGERAPGRAILRVGVKTRNGKVRPATKREKAAYVRQLRKLLKPPSYPTLTIKATPPKQPPARTATATPRVTGGPLASIRSCESGGNYRAISPGGTYRGAYQFDYSTWRSVGGSGDPAAASPAEQDKRAAMLYSRRGAQPWPVCGR